MTDNLKKIISYALILFALIGIFDTAYLSSRHISGESVACGITNGCDSVLTSKYSEIFGVPLAFAGLAYYFIILIFAFIYAANGSSSILRALASITGTGLAASAYFVYLQFFIIGSICTYCIGSAITTFILFILSITLYKTFKIS